MSDEEKKTFKEKVEEAKGSVKNLTDGFLVFSQNIPFCPV